MKLGKAGRAGSLVAIGLLAGFLFGPAFVRVASSAVTVTDTHIMDRNSNTRANVNSDHRMTVDTEAGVTNLGGADYLNSFAFAITAPNGEVVLVSEKGTSEVTLQGVGVITGVNVNARSTLAGTATLTITEGSPQAPGEVIWEGSVPGGTSGGVRYQFENGIFEANGFFVAVDNINLDYEVYGEGFGLRTGADSAVRRVMHSR